VEEVEGVGGGAGEGVMVQNLLGQGADQGFAADGPMVELLGAAEDFVEVERAIFFCQDIYYYIYIRHRLSGAFWAAAFGAAQQTESTELGVGAFFKDVKEILAGEGLRLGRFFHKLVDRVADILYMSILNYTIYWYCAGVDGLRALLAQIEPQPKG